MSVCIDGIDYVTNQELSDLAEAQWIEISKLRKALESIVVDCTHNAEAAQHISPHPVEWFLHTRKIAEEALKEDAR